jgi:hypothetical protein
MFVTVIPQSHTVINSNAQQKTLINKTRKEIPYGKYETLKVKQFFQNEVGKSKSVLGMVIACSAILTLLTAYTLVPLQYSATAQAVVPLDPLTIPKFVNQLTGPPPVYDQVAPNEYAVDMVEIMQQVLPPGFPQTKVWGYGGLAKDAVKGDCD